MQVFHNELLHQNHEEHFLPDNIIPQIFSSIKSIYQFHHDFLLPQLDQCMASWSVHAVCVFVLDLKSALLRQRSYCWGGYSTVGENCFLACTIAGVVLILSLFSVSLFVTLL